jgi:hypothetical protein
MRVTHSVRIKWLASFLFASMLTLITAAEPLEYWHWRNPSPAGNTLNSVTYGNGTFVAVGDGGNVQTSADGVNWTVPEPLMTNSLLRIIYANGLFLAVGDRGAVLTSNDGISWTPRVSGVTNRLLSATFGNSQFLVVGTSGVALISTNAIQWSPINTGLTSDFNWAAFGNGKFVLPVGTQPKLLLSTNLAQWVMQPVAGFLFPFLSLAFGNGEFRGEAAATGNTGPWYLYSSTDLVNWVKGPADADIFGTFGCQLDHRVLAFLNGSFFEVADNTCYYNGPNRTIVALPNGQNWSAFSLSGVYPVLDATYGAGKYVMVGTGGLIMTSPTGSSWTLVTRGVGGRIVSLASGNGVKVAVGGGVPMPFDSRVPDRTLVGSTSTIGASTNGGIFGPVSSAGSPMLGSATFGGGAFVAVGLTGALIRSTNGTDWVARGSGTTKDLTKVCYGTNLFVAVGGAGTLITSPNGMAWTLRNSGTGYPLYGVTYGYGQYVAVGYFGTVVTSPDGFNWTVQYSDTTSSLFAVTSGNGRFVAVGADGSVSTSDDGINWTSQSSGTPAYLYGVSFGNGEFVACGGSSAFQGPSYGNVLLRSHDGVAWENLSSHVVTPTGIYGIAFFSNSFWIGGEYGTVLQSDPVALQPFLTGKVSSNPAGYQVTVWGMETQNYRIQASTSLNPVSWSDVSWVTNSEGGHVWTDAVGPEVKGRYYRAVCP